MKANQPTCCCDNFSHRQWAPQVLASARSWGSGTGDSPLGGGSFSRGPWLGSTPAPARFPRETGCGKLPGGNFPGWGCLADNLAFVRTGCSFGGVGRLAAWLLGDRGNYLVAGESSWSRTAVLGRSLLNKVWRRKTWKIIFLKVYKHCCLL